MTEYCFKNITDDDNKRTCTVFDVEGVRPGDLSGIVLGEKRYITYWRVNDTRNNVHENGHRSNLKTHAEDEMMTIFKILLD